MVKLTSKQIAAKDWHAQYMQKLRVWCSDAKEQFEEKAAIKEFEAADDYPERHLAESAAFLEVLNHRKANGLPVTEWESC